MTMWIIIFSIVFSLMAIIYYIVDNFYKKDKIDTNHVNENSYQKYAKFYGEIIPSDKDFDYKLNKIYTLIKNNKYTDINKIAGNANCTIAECVLKIKYLKNKRLLDDLYIDTVNMKLLPCSLEDQALLDKYRPYIYGSHGQISDFVTTISNPEHLSINRLKEKILEDLKYLDSKSLLNGVKIDDIDGEIIYYTIEKRKTVKNRETVHCPNCGALNDVEINGKCRCGYCSSIVMGSSLNN